MTTKISKLTDTFSGTGPGALYNIVIDPETLAAPGPSVSGTATLEITVTISDVSAASTGSLQSRASYYNIAGTLTRNANVFNDDFDSNCVVTFAVVGNQIDVLVTPSVAVQTDGRIWIDIKAHS